MIDIAQRREDNCAILLTSLHFHRQVPMGLGSGRTSVEHKLRCIAQKVTIECAGVAHAKTLMSRIRSLCVDMGTELSMADAGLDLQQALPPWMANEMVPDIQDDAAEDIETHPEFIMPRTLLVPGTCHVLHNLSSDVDSVSMVS